MNGHARTNSELLEEISILNKKINQLEKTKTGYEQVEDTLHLFKYLVENSSDAIGMSTPEGRFASDVITSIKIPALRDYLEEIITKRFNQ